MDSLQNEKHYKMALSRIWDLMEKLSKDPAEAQEMDMLATLVEAYEAVQIPMQPGDPIAFLKYKMEQENLKQGDLIPFIGDKSKIYNVLNYKQELTVTMIRSLSKGLGIPANFLIPS
ncbi:type II toxin-antitoxin system HigA family antitoxin [Persicitalea sp.]|uniref:helix-turn-helix domain-containing protein n=1 Tax=Persicitalea sp. TaxID=3100273 RepID=UPI003593C893